MRCSLVTAWGSVLRLETQQATNRYLLIKIQKEKNQKKCVFLNGGKYYARKAFFPLCSIMKFLFKIKQHDSHDVLYVRKNNHRYCCNARKDNCIVYICGQRDFFTPNNIRTIDI